MNYYFEQMSSTSINNSSEQSSIGAKKKKMPRVCLVWDLDNIYALNIIGQGNI